MNEKELNQVEELINGVRRYKFFDPTRKAVLALPPYAFKLWMTYWSFENDEREAYPSLDKLEEVTQLGRQAILRAREYLLETGWLIKLTGSAAERYAKPSRGAHNVAIYRVDDPTKGVSDTPVPNTPNVLSSCSSSNRVLIPSCPVHYNTVVAGEPEGSSLRSDEQQNQQQDQEQKQKQKPMRLSSAQKWALKYDALKPPKFDTWSQSDRSTWVLVHALNNLEDKEPPTPSAAKAATVPPAKAATVLHPVEPEKDSAPPQAEAPAKAPATPPVAKQGTSAPPKPPKTPPPLQTSVRPVCYSD